MLEFSQKFDIIKGERKMSVATTAQRSALPIFPISERFEEKSLPEIPSPVGRYMTRLGVERFVCNPSLTVERKGIYNKNSLIHGGAWALLTEAAVDFENETAISKSTVSVRRCRDHFDVVPGVMLIEIANQSLASLAIQIVNQKRDDFEKLSPVMVSLTQVKEFKFRNRGVPGEEIQCYTSFHHEKIRQEGRYVLIQDGQILASGISEGMIFAGPNLKRISI